MNVKKSKNQKMDSENWKQGLFISILGIILTIFFYVGISLDELFYGTNVDGYKFILKIIGIIFLFSIYIFSTHKYVYTKVINIFYILVASITLFLFILLSLFFFLFFFLYK